MKKQWIAAGVLVCILSAQATVFAELAERTQKSQMSEEKLQDMSRDAEKRRLEELARSITNLERRMSRLDDRFEKLDHDLKELKRKL